MAYLQHYFFRTYNRSLCQLIQSFLCNKPMTTILQFFLWNNAKQESSCALYMWCFFPFVGPDSAAKVMSEPALRVRMQTPDDLKKSSLVHEWMVSYEEQAEESVITAGLRTGAGSNAEQDVHRATEGVDRKAPYSVGLRLMRSARLQFNLV